MLSVPKKKFVPVRKQLGSLWLLATPDSYRSVGERFDLAKSSLNNSFMKVFECLNTIASEIISWPRGQELEKVKEDFNKNSPLRGIIGAIDGFAGSVGDLRVFKNSDLWKEVEIDKQSYFPNDKYIIGDKAYPVLTWCIPPYIDRGQLTVAQQKFNVALSSKRSVIERAFALLKGRFRRLKFLDMNVDEMIPHVIIACTVLHNICLNNIDENNIEDFIQEGMENNEACNEVCDRNDIFNEKAKKVKREYLCALVAEN